MTHRPCRVNPILLGLARDLRRRSAPAERILWECLRKRKLNGYKFRRQFPVDTFVADFYCAECSLAVELDGKSHKDRQQYDAIRTEFLNEQGLSVIRFPNNDVYKRLEDVLHVILRECESRAPDQVCPSPRPSPLSTGEREENSMRILLTTTSFQDTPGKHHDVLGASGFEIVRARGPLSEAQILEQVTTGGGFDGLLNGDDQITARVIDAALPRLRVIAKYGIGLDSVDVKYATAKKIPVLFTPGVNETTVAEHTFGLMIGVAKNFWFHLRSVKEGRWERKTGSELFGKTLGVIGMGRIGKEVVKRAAAFGMSCVGYDPYWDEAFAADHDVRRLPTPLDVLRLSDVVSLHTSLTAETSGFINRESIALMKDGAILLNTARGGLVVEQDVADACRSGKLRGYGADVLEQEPMKTPHVFQEVDNVLITPHVGSRTNESVQRQGLRAANNLVNFLRGNSDYVQANKF